MFRTAYYIAKKDRPYSDHPDLISLQEINGLNLGRILHSNVTCSDIIDHIADDMRKSLIDSILHSKRPFAVLIDESTSLSRASCMVVYLRSTFNVEVGPVTFFLDCIELADTTADGIELALLNCLGSHGLNNEFLVKYFLGLGVDGASVMLGAKNGVAAKLKSKFPLLTSWHCFNHRLESVVCWRCSQKLH